MPSVHFVSLKDEVDRLRAALASRLDPVGVYTEEEKRRTVAYVALVHGCVEMYLESRCKEISAHAADAWKKGRVNRTLLSLLSFSGAEFPSPTVPPDEASKRGAWQARHELGERIERALKAYEKVLRGNNGIKEKNLVALLLPIGFELSTLDSVMVATLNSFGKDRGYAVHVVDQEFRDATDPKTEIDRAAKIVGFLETLDGQLDSLLV